MKRCSECGATKALREFYADPARADGHRAACKGCELARKHAWYRANREQAIATARAWQQRNPERHRENQERHNARRRSEQRADHLRRTFGLTLDDYDALLAQQGGICAVCHQAPPEDRFLHVDHDHSTGEIRGLLCVRCNNALGLLREDVEIAERAVDYLDANGFAPAGVYELRDMAVARARGLVSGSG